ncbi:ferredoxin--NADP reductase [Pseudoalteromonas phenolica]|uniref:ferredoxin--NADP(+) reductase n=1 Tax=Pseudoalteromonas phenolica TaxID=161398 RepID=A0A0S2K8D8_9GAMM|nr:ferredoxin--NADP reductase [Pseudoalteromonas phenolica]ALO44398.1 Ferredoxin--NADP reductase [Pseudoalteromonas phenolica]MBE0357410.1 ferredoxin--NADP+ reductase [Pseudoalteromonas phenolica O-BC30]RXF01522.1 ferredoxin--NADP reductase [Pseudoalteromonas phenolica O-BC30]
MSQWVSGKITEVNWWTPTLFTIKVAADVAPFQAGQFTKLAMTIGEKRIARAYSYVNAPKDPVLEFYLTEVESGKLTSGLVELSVGDSIDVESKANGFLTIEESPKREILWMIASGTGIGPFLSILADGKVWDKYQQVVLIHSVRFNTDLTYQDFIHAHQKLFKQFTYLPLVTRESPERGLEGRVTDLIKSSEFVNYCNLEKLPEDSHFMICGNPQMVKDLTQLLQSVGYKRHRRAEPGHISVEQYW